MIIARTPYIGGIARPLAPLFGLGWDFRATSDYVTDPSDCTYDIGELYPTTRAGVTFGWDVVAGSDSRNRSTSVDPRLAGIVFINNSGLPFTWRLDLQASGDYQISLALGDAAGGNPQKVYFVLKDDTVPRITFSPINTGSNQFADAAGNLWTAAQWPGSNVAVQKTFSSGILNIVLGGTVDSDASAIAHLFVQRV